MTNQRSDNKPASRRALALLGVLMVAASVSLVGCNTFKNSHGRQNKPHVLRIVSIPSSAKLTLPKRNLVLYTPADIEIDLSKSEPVLIEKDGYLPFEGVLGDLPEVARKTYEARLSPR